jgi:hypothetical protein
VGPLTGVVAHGGTAGAVVEALLVLGVVAVFVAVWARERESRRRSGRPTGAEDEPRIQEDRGGREHGGERSDP